MKEYLVGKDLTSIEIIKKALVWYYRAWSYYWRQKPLSCVIHPAESFVGLANEVLCFIPREVMASDVERLQRAFAQNLTFIATKLPENQVGYSMSLGVYQNPTSLLKQFLTQIKSEYVDLCKAVETGRGREKRRQEWRFSESGTYFKYLDVKTTRLAMRPTEGEIYTYTIIKDNQSELYFTKSKSGPKGNITEQGEYRRHKHDVGKQTYDNLDFFPESDYPTLWRLVKAGRGFKAFIRKVSPISNVSFPIQ